MNIQNTSNRLVVSDYLSSSKTQPKIEQKLSENPSKDDKNISFSKDGDTLELSISTDEKDKEKSLSERLKDEKSYKEKLEKLFPSSDDSDEKEKTSVSTNGKSELDLTRLYLTGKISRNDYEKAIEEREERLDEKKKGEDTFTNNMFSTDDVLDRTLQDLENIKTAFSSDFSKLNSTTRLDLTKPHDLSDNKYKDKKLIPSG